MDGDRWKDSCMVILMPGPAPTLEGTISEQQCVNSGDLGGTSVSEPMEMETALAVSFHNLIKRVYMSRRHERGTILAAGSKWSRDEKAQMKKEEGKDCGRNGYKNT